MSVAVSSSSQSQTGSRPTSAGAAPSERAADEGGDQPKRPASIARSSDADMTPAAYATTSRVTLEEFKKQKQHTLKTSKEDLLKTHEHSIRMMCYMMSRENRFDLEGSPSMPPGDDRFDLTPDEFERFQKMVQRFSLTKEAGDSIVELGLPTLAEAREVILRNITATRKLILPQRPRPDLSTVGALTSAGRSHSQSMLPPATTPLLAGEKPRKTSAGSASKATAMLPRLPLTDVPMIPVAQQMLPIAPQTTLPLPPPPTISILPDQPPVQALQLQAQTQALKEASQGSTSALSDVVSAPIVASQSTTLLTGTSSQTSLADVRIPTSIDPANIVSASSPLHPTLQALASNPLSVTYASSLRPLPQDPFRRYTGIGIGGGAVHHRGHRKAPQLPSKNGVPPPAGPAGAGGVDLFQWAVRARASPGAGLVGKADKCLLTTDWKVAFTEQRFIRTMNRIEKLKSEGKWSFRQPKKQKGPAIRKAHWDHVLEEMRWLQTDFKQERRWKITVAYQLALAARECVRAKTPQARARLTVKTRPIRFLDDRAMDEDDLKALGSSSREQVESGAESAHMDVDVEEGKQDEDLDADADADGVEDAPGEDDVDAEGEDDDGEVEAVTRLHSAQKEIKLEAGTEPTVHPADQIVAQIPSTEAGATTLVGKDNAGGKNIIDLAQQLPMNVISNVRAPIFAMDVIATSVSPMALLEHVDSDRLADMLGISPHELGQYFSLDDMSLSMLFPELPPFDAPAAPTDAKAERRWDDGSLNQPPRLTHVSRLMDSKPILVSTLQPAKNRAKSQWRTDGEWGIAAELADPTKGVPADVADAPPLPGSVLFTRKSNKPSRDLSHTLGNIPLPQAPSNASARSSQFIWTTDEDNFLLSLIRQYGQHWLLISNLFNAARLSVPTDVREAWDCYDRYQKIQQAAAEGKPPPGPTLTNLESENGGGKSSTGASTPQLNNSLHMKQEKLTKKVGAKYDGSRKKLRRYNITEVMKKCAKRRAEVLQRTVNHSKQVNLQSHETHNQIKQGVTPTPQQLSLLKAERDEAHARQFALMQQQHRQAQAQAQAAAAAAAAQQQQSQGSGQPAVPATTQAPTSKPQAAQAPAAGTANSQQNLQAQQQQHQQQLQAQQQRLLQQLAAQQQQNGNGQQLTPQQQQQRFAAAAAAAQQASAAGQQQQHQQQQQQSATQQMVRPNNNAVAASAASPAPATVAAGGATQTQARPAASNAGSNANAGATAHGIPAQLAALQATLTQSLANNPSFTPEQINTLAIQLYRQAQQQGGLSNINLGGAQNRQGQSTAARLPTGQQTVQARPVGVQGQAQAARPPANTASSPVTQPGKPSSVGRPPSSSPQKQGTGGESKTNAGGQTASSAAAKGKKG